MPQLAFALVTIRNASAKCARERPARRAAPVIPGITSDGRGTIRPRSQRPRSPDTPVLKFVVTNRILALCPFHFSAAQNSAAPAKMRRSLSFVAAVLPPLMRTRT
jgi:hypothetical protein